MNSLAGWLADTFKATGNRKKTEKGKQMIDSAPTRKCMKVQVFYFGHFLQSKISLESSFLMKYYIITNQTQKNR